MDFDVIRKKFEMTIRIKRWYYQKTIVVKYEQATMYNVIEFLYENESRGFNIINWMVDFIEENSDKKLNKIDKILLGVKFDSIFKELQESYFLGAFENKSGNSSGIDDKTSDLSSYISFLSKELKQDPLQLMKNYTTSQLEYFTNGIVRNINEQTPEGQKKNRLSRMGANLSNIDNESVKNLLSKLDEAKCSEQGKFE